MKRTIRIATIAVCLVAGGAFAQNTPDPSVTDDEFDSLVHEIDRAQATLMELISGLTDEQWRFKPNPDRWSVGECVEHIARSERALLEQIKQIVASPRDPEWFTRTKGKTDLLRQAVPNRSPQGQGGRQAPIEIQPTENWDRAKAIQEFYSAHGEVRAFAETMDRNIKDRTEESGAPTLGWLNAYDWLTIAPLHVIRHSKQILEVQQDPNYPKAPAPIPQDVAAGKAPSPLVTDAEFATLLEDIDKAQETLLGLISGMTDEQWTFKQNAERWSVAECVEHIVRTEQAVLGGIQLSIAGPRDPEWFGRTNGKNELVRSSVLTRNPGGAGSPFRAPYEVQPTEQWDRAQAIQEFYTAHGTLRAFVETMQRDIKDHTFMNPFPSINWLNCHDWLTLTALHVRRHSLQIVEVQQDPNYPK